MTTPAILKHRGLWIVLGAAAVGVGLAACGAMSAKPEPPPLPTVSQVDLPRFMGRWYVIANIPPWLERHAMDSSDNYRLLPDGSIDIDFIYREGGFDAEQKHLRSNGVVQDAGNAIWGVQFVWPIRADYRIAWLAPDYGSVVIARQKRDYVWIMARTPTLPEAQYQELVQRVGAMGYDTTKLNRVRQRGG